MPEPGELLGESYRIVEVRVGGMGEVYICEVIAPPGLEASDPGKGPRRVALKTFRRQYFFDNAIRLSFVREASSWLRLSGLPHIMPVLGIQTIGDRPFVLMPAVTPGPLGERSLADLFSHGPLDPGVALDFAFQLALALREAAKRIPGIVHGDLKPANVLLLGGDAYLADFGLVSAVSLGRPDLRLEGTWAYRAPELWTDGSRPPSVATDVYAFGVLLFELLTGTLPFTAADHDRDGWQAAHREQRPRVPAKYPADGLPAAALALSLACLAKDPAARPSDFSDIFGRINGIYEEYDIVNHLMRWMRTGELLQLWQQELPGWREQRIRSLLGMDEPRQALEELDAIPQDEYDATLWMCRGTALSLLDRDAEALTNFERALAGDLSPRDKVNCECELALSLKRLGRFDEARAVYERLLVSVPGDQVTQVVVNLATVYLQQKDGAEAVRLLEPFVRRVPDVPEAWANLGQAYVFVGRYSDAESAYGRALWLAPQLGQVRVTLAALYMDHLGQFEAAWSALDAAFDSGHESREWIVRMLACSLLLGKRDSLAGLAMALRDNFPPDLAQRIHDEGLTMAQELVNKYSARDAGDPPRDSGEVGSAPQDCAPESETGGAQDSPALPAVSPSIHTPEEHAPSRPGLPFLNFRFYGFHDFTLDYYDSPEEPDFVERFLTEWRRAIRDPRFAAPLRGTPFYFTRCNGCGVHVLTNRDHGKWLNCRMCDSGGPTEAIRGSPFDQLVKQVSDVLGVVRLDADSVHILFVQEPEEAGPEVIREVCTRAGMVEIEKDRLLAMHMLQEAGRRLRVRYELPWTVWMLRGSEIELWIRDATPRAISAVVRELHDRVPGVRTLSTTLPAETVTEMGESINDLIKWQERELRERIRKGTAEAADLRHLALNLDSQKQFVEAQQMARAALGADEDSAEGWHILGRILFQQKQYQTACEAFERSLVLDPTAVLTLGLLAACYAQLGDGSRAHELYAKVRSLSGGEFILGKSDVH
jgi:serine/threonine protein kinase/Flp pilus assembly protein TadD